MASDRVSFPFGQNARSAALATVLLLLATVVVYLPAFQAGFIWDDDEMLTGNTLVKSASGLGGIWFSTELADYFPLTSTSLWLEWQLWGMNAAGYHVTNVLLHACSALLLWRVLLRLRVPGAWLAGLLFAVHPVCVQSVAWITERKNTLSLVFYLLSLLWFLRYDEAAEGSAAARAAAPSRAGRRFYILSLIAFLLALLSKTSVVMLPVVLLLSRWWRRHQRPAGKPAGLGELKQELVRVLPFFGIALVLALVTIWFQNHSNIRGEPINTNSFAARLAGAGWVVWFYLYKSLLPVGLCFVYPQWQINPSSLRSYLPLLALIGGGAFLWSRRRSWGAPFLFALGYFVLSLFPVMGFFNIYFQRYSPVADHWQYVAIIGIIAVVAGLLSAALKGYRLAGVAAVLALGLSVLSWQRVRVYTSVETLWSDTLERNPGCWMAHNNWGYALYQAGKVPEAIEHFRASLRLRPDNFEAHNNFAVALTSERQLDAAAAEYLAAMRARPDLPAAYVGLAGVLREQGKPEEAAGYLRAALQRDPRSANAHFELGSLLDEQGDSDQALAQYLAAVQAKPDHGEAWNNLSNLYAKRRDLQRALACGAEAVRLRPTDGHSHYNLGNALALIGNSREAAQAYSEAVRLEPGFPEARYNFGSMLLLLGQLDEAARQLAEAVRLQPTNTAAQAKLASALAGGGKLAPK